LTVEEEWVVEEILTAGDETEELSLLGQWKDNWSQSITPGNPDNINAPHALFRQSFPPNIPVDACLRRYQTC